MIAMYILRCADDSYYVGSTKNLDSRMEQHSAGLGSSYTSSRMPVELVFFQEFGRIDDAYFMEKRVQGWSRAKREALIEGRYEDLKGLSKKRLPRPPAG